MPIRYVTRALSAGAVALAAVACADEPGPTEVEPPAADAETVGVDGLETASLTDLVTVNVGGSELTFWPYTGRTPTIGDAADPVDMILVGDADPREIRARLMALGGDRFPPPLDQFPFDCTWSDAIGGTQSVFVEGYGWAGSVIQLQCGDFETLRFHTRLFRVGDLTFASSHLDFLIPGTTDHEVLSWELARWVLLADLARIGATPVDQSGEITQAPTYRTVRPEILGPLKQAYDNAGPGSPPDVLFAAQLYALLIGDFGPPVPTSIEADGDLLNGGRALVVSVPEDGGPPSGGAVISEQTLTVQFGQFIPRPFCDDGGEAEVIRVDGPVTLTQKVVYTPSGNFVSEYHAKGHLDVQIVSPVPSEPYRALVNQHGRSVMTDELDMVNDIQLRMEIRPGDEESGQIRLNVRIGPDGVGEVSGAASCKP